MSAQGEETGSGWRRPWRVIAWAGGLLIVGVGTAISDTGKELTLGALRWIGSLVSSAATWSLEPSRLPNGIALLASMIVVAAASVGTALALREWWRRVYAQRSPAEHFRGAKYDGFLWQWTSFCEGGEPKDLDPLCPLDGTALLRTLSRIDAMTISSNAPSFLGCPCCATQFEMPPGELRRVAALVKRDAETGHWRTAQKQFDRNRRRLAATSKATAPPP